MRFRSLSALGAFALLAALMFTVSASGAPNGDSKAKSYIVVMALEPAVAYDGGVAGIPATKPAKGEKINPNSANVKRYQAHLKAQHDKSLADAGAAGATRIHDYSIALNGYSAILTEAQADAIRTQKSVVRVIEDELRQPTTDASPEYLGLSRAGGAWLRGIDGRGVVVGVIDSGIWPEHPSFADDGSYPAPPVSGIPCEFGNTAHNANDVAFTCQNKLIGARQMLDTYRAVLGAEDFEFDSARDDNGHGTHTASTAAGNRDVPATLLGIDRGKVSGIAPRAHVVAYKGLGDGGGFGSDLAAAIDQAVADGVDVINYSIGGGASLTGVDDIAFLFAADAGVFSATSAGNSGNAPGTIGGPGSVPWLTTVGANTQKRSFQGTVVLGNGASYTGVTVTEGLDSAPLIDAAGSATGATPDLCVPGTLTPAVEGKIVLCRRGVIARVAKSQAVMLAGGVGMIMYENNDQGDLASDPHFVPSVHVDNTPGLAIKSYIAATVTPTARFDNEQIGTWESAPSMTLFSSRGPNSVALDIIKPDITAPGIQILAGNTPFPAPGTGPEGELFQAIAGTSMSSPHIAGIFALIKQARPDWTAAMAKSAIMTTANTDVRDNDRVSQAGPFAQGAGEVDPGRPSQPGSAFQPGLVYDAGLFEYFGFLCDAEPTIFVDPAGTCGFLEANDVPTTATDLNLPSFAVSQLAGSQTVQRTVTSVAEGNGRHEYRVSVEAPEGYDVSVSPSTLQLRTGESATYEVTFTNVSAPIDEWKFGSLTWKGAGHDVSSPIALRAAKFDAPLEITGSGVDGSASFDVKFGYTGAYAAVPHGLIQATETDDNVDQDADADEPSSPVFQPADVTNGGANAHTFTLSDTGVFRVAIPPDATEANADLDVFVYGPAGTLVASSTLGGTDEEVTLQSPANGTYTVYVHGWAAPGGDSDYTLYSWEVPNATGGSLTASGPSSATIGTTGTINLSWTGAIGWNLGAVSHNEGSTLLGRTLVEVDNR